MLCSTQYIIENELNLLKENKEVTYGKFKLTDAYKQLIDSIRKGYQEKAQMWSIQINISYEFNRLKKKLIDYYFSEINLCNPKLIHLIYSDELIYNLEVLKEYNNSKQLVYTFHNHQIIRNHLARLVSVMTSSNKKKIPTLEKIIDDDFNFNIPATRKKIKYYNNIISNEIMLTDDDKNLIIPINEILNTIKANDRQISSQTHLLFWLNWIFVYNKKYNRQNSNRKFSDKMDDKYTKDIVWILWDIIIKYGKNLSNDIIKKLLYLYCDDFKPSQKAKKKNIIIMAFLIILNTNNINDINIPLYSNYILTMQSVLNINPLYEKVKNI